MRYAGNVYDSQVNKYPKAPLTNIGYEGMLRGWRNNGYRWPQDGHKVEKNDNGYLFELMRRRTGIAVDLPTEAQWEFAARAGSTTSLPFDLAITNATTDATACEFAWCKANADGAHHPVGAKRPNAWGLYDVLGNVSEMCLDVWSDDITVYGEIYPPGFATVDRTSCVIRGGNYTSNSGDTRLGSRLSVLFSGASNNYTGFRIWCPIPDESAAQ